MPGVEPVTSWVVARHADHLGNEIVTQNITKNMHILIKREIFYQRICTRI